VRLSEIELLWIFVLMHQDAGIILDAADAQALFDRALDVNGVVDLNKLLSDRVDRV
jgi:hypothetical protein